MTLKETATGAVWGTRWIWGVALAILIGLVLLSGCATTATPVREVTVTKEVPVPYYQPCPKAGDKPVVPKRVHDEHPVMPSDKDATIKILAAKVLELFSYATTADAELAECSRPR
jgi:hypothetical protein